MKLHHQGQGSSLHALQGQTKTKASFLVGKIPWAKREPCSLWCGNRLFPGHGACRALGKGFCSGEGLRALHSTQLVPWAAARHCLRGFVLFFFFFPLLSRVFGTQIQRPLIFTLSPPKRTWARPETAECLENELEKCSLCDLGRSRAACTCGG